MLVFYVTVHFFLTERSNCSQFDLSLTRKSVHKNTPAARPVCCVIVSAVIFFKEDIFLLIFRSLILILNSYRAARHN